MKTSRKATTETPSSIALVHGDGMQSITDVTASLTTLTSDIEQQKEARTKRKKEARVKRSDAPQQEPRRLASKCRGACKFLIEVLLGITCAAFFLGMVFCYGLMLYILVPYTGRGGSWIAFAFFLLPPVGLCLCLVLTCCEKCDK